MLIVLATLLAQAQGGDVVATARALAILDAHLATAPDDVPALVWRGAARLKAALDDAAGALPGGRQDRHRRGVLSSHLHLDDGIPGPRLATDPCRVASYHHQPVVGAERERLKPAPGGVEPLDEHPRQPQPYAASSADAWVHRRFTIAIRPVALTANVARSVTARSVRP